jgi:hypothetical protein
MGTITYKVCDRCGEKISPHSNRLSSFKKLKHRLVLFGLVYEDNLELCGKCSEEFDDFLRYPNKTSLKDFVLRNIFQRMTPANCTDPIKVFDSREEYDGIVKKFFFSKGDK